MNWSIGFGSKHFGDGALTWSWLTVGRAWVGFFFSLSLKKLIQTKLKKLIQTRLKKLIQTSIEAHWLRL